MNYVEPQKLGLFLDAIKIQESNPYGTSIVPFDSQSFCSYLNYYYSEGNYEAKRIFLEGFKPVLRSFANFGKLDARSILNIITWQKSRIEIEIYTGKESGLVVTFWATKGSPKVGIRHALHCTPSNLGLAGDILESEKMKVILHLCSLGFDVFGWTEKGLAIDRKGGKK